MLGFIGLRTVLGILIIIFLPFYLIFDNFNLSQEEKISFSFFVGIMMFPSLAYLLGFIVPFKISIFVTFVSLLILGYLLKKYLKYGLIAVFFILAISVNGKSTYDVLKGQQYSIGRVNPWQFEAAEWVRSNLPEEADIYDMGTLGYQYYGGKIKWLGALSQRHFVMSNPESNLTDYVLIDYTDAILLRDQNYIDAVQNFEKNFQNITTIYNKNNIRVYQFAGFKIR